MKTLVVGGTGFLGEAVARCAASRSHDVSVLTRNPSPRDPLSGVAYLTGDRLGDLDCLGGREFDIVVDSCAYSPSHVTKLFDAIQTRPKIYALISSISVYGEYTTPQIDEQYPVPDATPEQLSKALTMPRDQQTSGLNYGDEYGPLKVAAENEAIRLMGNGAMLIRAGLLVGARDYTDRMTYWVRRVDSDDTIAAPLPQENRVQWIDVRDAADFIISNAERQIGGVFNLTSRPAAFSSILQTCIACAGKKPTLKWISEDKINAAGIEGWTEFPLWLPPSSKTYAHFLNVSVEKAITHGLRIRPLAETIENILAWDRSRRDEKLKVGLSLQQEFQLLQ